MATVGIPIDMAFDIQKAEFKLTIRVRPEDKPVVVGGADEETGMGMEEKRELPPTEIFLPVVHYASDRAVGGLLAQSIYAEDPSSPSSSSSSRHHPSETSSQETVQETDCPTTPTDAPNPSLTPYPPQIESTIVRAPSKTGESHSQSLAVEVEVSEGRWEIEEGVLRWWYDVEETEMKEVKVTIKRRGGRIWTREEREREGLCGGGWDKMWRERCGMGGCTIM